MAFGPDRDEQRRQGRRKPHRDPKTKILIVCEGCVTEPEYFRGLANVHRGAVVELEIIEGAGVPLTVVQEAKKRKDQAARDAKQEGDPFLIFEAVWCVFDVDEHPNISQARDLARRSGIKLAMSNPCFELWLLLHLRDAPGMIHRDALRQALKEFIPGYHKHVDFGRLRQGYDQAVTRARQLDSLAESVNEPGRNPTTGVYKLTQAIAHPTPLATRRETDN